MTLWSYTTLTDAARASEPITGSALESDVQKEASPSDVVTACVMAARSAWISIPNKMSLLILGLPEGDVPDGPI